LSENRPSAEGKAASWACVLTGPQKVHTGESKIIFCFLKTRMITLGRRSFQAVGKCWISLSSIACSSIENQPATVPVLLELLAFYLLFSS